MRFQVQIEAPTDSNKFASVTINGNSVSSEIKFDQAVSLLEMHRSNQPNSETTLDLVLLGCTVFALDKLFLRTRSVDAWTRDYEVELPVSNIQLWESVRVNLEKCLCFLTGDAWNLTFVQRDKSLLTVVPGKEQKAKAVSLFSGGLDSLIGVIDYLEDNPDQNLFLVGHRDFRGVKGVMKDQLSTFDKLKSYYNDRISIK